MEIRTTRQIIDYIEKVLQERSAIAGAPAPGPTGDA